MAKVEVRENPNKKVRQLPDPRDELGGEFYGPSLSARGGRTSMGTNPLNETAADKAYFANLAAEAQRRAKASVPYDTSAYLDTLEARGLGRSSIAGEGVRGIQAHANTMAQQGVMNVQGLQWQARQQRINAYLNYLYQSKLQKQSQDQGMFGSLFSIGKAIPFLLNPGLGTAAVAAQGFMDSPAGPSGYTPYTPYEPGGNYA